MLPDQEAQHSPSSWGHLKPYLLVFLVTAMAVYVWIAAHPRKASTEPGGTAKAVISVETPGRGCPCNPNPEALRSQFVTEENLARALTHCNDRWSLPPSMERIRRNLEIKAQRNADASSVQIALSLADDDLTFASGVVNALADRYAEGCRTTLREDSRRSHRAAVQSLDESRQQLRQARAELEGFLERHFREQEELARQALAASRAPAAAPAPLQPAPAPTAVSVLVDNPEWVRVHEQLQAKRRALIDMLTVRTPLHPDAQALQSDVSEFERRLLATPRQMAKVIDGATATMAPVGPPPAATSAAESPAAMVPGKLAAEQLEAAQTYVVLSGELRRAADREAQLAEAERLAWQQQFRLPNVSLTDSAQPALVQATAGSRVLWVALIAAMAVTSGVGMIFSRPGTDPLIGSAAEAERALGVPVLGVVHTPDSGDDMPMEPVSDRGSMAWLLGGMACITGAVVLVLTTG